MPLLHALATRNIYRDLLSWQARVIVRIQQELCWIFATHGCLRATDVIIVGMRASVCGYGKDSAFALRDSGARMFTGEGDEDCASALRGSGALCCLPNVTPSARCRRTLEGSRRPPLCLLNAQLQHHRFGPRLSLRSSERPVTSTRNWRNCTFLAQSSNGAQITRQVVCRVSVGQKSELRAHQLAPPGVPRTSHDKRRPLGFLRFSGTALRLKAL